MPRPSDKARAAALQSGATTYRGADCARSHASPRFASNGACIECMRERREARRRGR